MGKGTKVVAHEGTGPGTGIFYKRGYGDGYYSTLPVGYPLPSLLCRLLEKRNEPQWTPANLCSDVTG
ncbi:hypothetical protein MTR_1g071320 [Medicago truncatula]|uniref:Uncharacterized protein n=1 Tax=Medicago truncatula TaxID=3880 RepID=G7ICR8_MEDTR|nr:hypothetical protein MTR_1g071320 [Medicago truncatula]